MVKTFNKWLKTTPALSRLRVLANRLASVMKIIGAITLLVATAPSAADTPVVNVDGPFILGYFPALTEEEKKTPDDGVTEGLAHIRFAIEDTLKCLEADGINAHAQIEVAAAVRIREGKHEKIITFPTAWPDSAGLYLFKPGKAPQIVKPEAGPSSLTFLGPNAAVAYFGAKSCKKD